MRNKKLMNKKKTTLHKDGSSALLNIALEKEGENKKKKSYYDKGYSYLVTHPSIVSAEQDLTLLSRRKVLRGSCFHSFFDFSQTFTSVCITR